MKKYRSLFFFALLFSMCLPAKGWTMSLFDFAKICLFSEVNGVVVNEGVPIAGAEIIQTVIKGGKTFRNTTKSNEQGEFHFDALFTKSISTILPVAPVYTQRIIIKHKGKDIRGWTFVKQNNQEKTELDGQPINLQCDVNSEDSRKETSNNVVLGICRWN